MFMCGICLSMKSPNRNHNKCLLPQCKFCFKLQLQRKHHWSYSMSGEFCNRMLSENPTVTKCELCQKDVPNACKETHSLICKRRYECPQCGLILYGKSIKILNADIAKHKCYSKLCKVCFSHIPPKDFKHHACVLRDVKFHDILNR